MNICIFASDLAIITGHNPYQDINEIYLKLWKKHYFSDFNKFLNEFKLVEETPEEYIEKIAQQNNLNEMSEKITTCLKSENVEELSKKKDNVLKYIEKLEPKEKKLVSECIKKITNTNFGTRNENSALSEYMKKTNDSVDLIEHFMKRPLYKTKLHTWHIGGKIDGINKDETIIEIKNRVHKLFYKLRNYEKVQTHAYMYIMDKQKSKLVECIKQQSKLVESVKKECLIDINVIDIDYDEDFWKTKIDPKIQRFIKTFEKMMKNREKKIELIGILFGSHS